MPGRGGRVWIWLDATQISPNEPLECWRHILPATVPLHKSMRISTNSSYGRSCMPSLLFLSVATQSGMEDESFKHLHANVIVYDLGLDGIYRVEKSPEHKTYLKFWVAARDRIISAGIVWLPTRTFCIMARWRCCMGDKGCQDEAYQTSWEYSVLDRIISSD